jgi:hypothetical protein
MQFAGYSEGGCHAGRCPKKRSGRQMRLIDKDGTSVAFLWRGTTDATVRDADW